MPGLYKMRGLYKWVSLTVDAQRVQRGEDGGGLLKLKMNKK